jgi:hypothetical protein
MLTFDQVVTVLARVHEIDDSLRSAFRSRLQNLQRLGVAPSLPGKGHKILYDGEAIFVWGVCLELAAFGIQPSVSAEFINLHWKKDLRPVFLSKKSGLGDTFLALTPRLYQSVAESEFRLGPLERLLYLSSRRSPNPSLSTDYRTGLINLTQVRYKILIEAAYLLFGSELAWPPESELTLQQAELRKLWRQLI